MFSFSFVGSLVIILMATFCKVSQWTAAFTRPDISLIHRSMCYVGLDLPVLPTPKVFPKIYGPIRWEDADFGLGDEGIVGEFDLSGS